MNRTLRGLALAAAAGLGAAGCNDFLTGGDLTSDPNRPLAATSQQLFVGVQSNLWALLLSAPNRYAGLWTQQFLGGGIQYQPIYNYERDESTTNGLYQGLYVTGGLVDVRRLEAQAAASRDSLFLGIAQVQEALLVGTGADTFGDIAYNGALAGEANVPLTPQLAVYDSVQVLLSRALVNLQSKASTNAGPGSADLSYGGSAAKWTRLAHTLKARYYLHTAEVRPAAYAQALAEARLGITSAGDAFVATFSGNANEQNFFYQFQTGRAGYYTPNPQFVALLKGRSDPRLADYFNADQSDLSDARLATNYTQALVTANENLLIWAESAQRTGATAEALAQLNAERALAGLAPAPASLAGGALLTEILTEKYISDFGSLEVWNDYKRTCFPNLTPTVAGEKVPPRLYYDQAERLTNSTIPDPNSQPFRNPNDPANKTVDGTGEACLGQ
jgi:hypothetical protein